MATPQQMVQTLKQAKRELTKRLDETADPAEIAKIEGQLDVLEGRIDDVALANLNNAAAMVADASNGLLAVVRSTNTNVLDGFAKKVVKIVGKLRVQIEETVNEISGEAREEPKTEDPEVEPVLPPPQPMPPPPADPVAPPPALPAVVKSKKFTQLKSEYEAEWANCEIRPDKRASVESALAKLRSHQAKYEEAAAAFNGMPWHFIGIIHGMETGFRLDRHFHNGDPLTARTIRVPKGRPKGTPPFTWEASARDAMVQMGFDGVTDWSVPHMLFLWEKYNGFGYRFKGLRTPYLWSFSNLYSKGRYVADGVFDPNAVSKQCGAAILLKALTA